jgi:hypothetical protein
MNIDRYPISSLSNSPIRKLADEGRFALPTRSLTSRRSAVELSIRSNIEQGILKNEF